MQDEGGKEEDLLLGLMRLQAEGMEINPAWNMDFFIQEWFTIEAAQQRSYKALTRFRMYTEVRSGMYHTLQ